MTLGEKIKAARKQKKLTQKELASLIGAAHNSISDWENGKNRPDPDTIQNLCWALEVTPNYLLGDYEEETTPNIPTAKNIFPIGKGTRIPLYGRIACGAPILAVEDLEETAWLPEGIKADFALTCCGDSMINARIFDGDIVFIRAAKSVENGEIAAVLFICNILQISLCNISPYHLLTYTPVGGIIKTVKRDTPKQIWRE